MRMQNFVYGSHADVDSRWQLPQLYGDSPAPTCPQLQSFPQWWRTPVRVVGDPLWILVHLETRHTTWTPCFALDMRPHTHPSFDTKCHLATRLPCTGIEWRRAVFAWMHPFDALAATTSTTMQHTRRRLTLFCAGTANSLLCTPATMWPPCQLLALLLHVSMFHLKNPYTCSWL
jgi:hypothetical protein